MPLQNRVDPFGKIVATPERGTLTGNRGVIHDPRTKTLLNRRWTTRAWIICVCDFRGRRRQVMGRNAPSGNAGWTELFFLDEVTALAAGHRPCFYCQRERAQAFMRCCAETLRPRAAKAGELDTRLHGQRLASGGTINALTIAEIEQLPDGTVVACGGAAFARRGGALLPWQFSGYGRARPLPDARSESGWVRITPAITVAALAAGYRPDWHASA